jgi:hypothetical protein
MNQSQYAHRIALGWVSLLTLLLVMLMTMIVFSALDDDGFSALRKDPGRGGIRAMSYVVAVYALMPIFVYIADKFRSAIVRWALTAVAASSFFFLILHHLSHWHGGDRPNFNSHVIDIAIHAVGLWLVYNSARWARAATRSGGAT